MTLMSWVIVAGCRAGRPVARSVSISDTHKQATAPDIDIGLSGLSYERAVISPTMLLRPAIVHLPFSYGGGGEGFPSDRIWMR